MPSSVTKSKVILGLIQDIPGFISKKNVKALATNPDNNLLGFEDASEAISSIEINEKESDSITKHYEGTKLADTFPNPRLSAELEIVKEIDRQKYHDFKNKILELDGLAKEIEEAAGPSLDFLLDELKQNADPKLIDEVKNMPVTLINIENGKVISKK